jgi:superfamily II RNA helicase
MEVLVSRMKAYSNLIRFVAVSATIPNACDFALWIGKRENQPQIIGGIAMTDSKPDEAAQLYTFSEAFRPCPLMKVRRYCSRL